MQGDYRGDIREIKRKFDALEIILTSPLWPDAASLNAAGRALHDALLEDAKPYALMIADERFAEAYPLAARWSRLAAAFMDATLINDTDPAVREANRRMLAVYRHYVDSVGVRWDEIEKKRMAA